MSSNSVLWWTERLGCMLQGTIRLASSQVETGWTLNLAGILLLLLFSLVYCWLLWNPIDITKDLLDVGFEHLSFGRKNRAGVVKGDVQNRSVYADDLPPVYPNGWIPVLQSRALPHGQVQPLKVCGQDLAVFRSDSGTVFVVDAICPHLGAHLGVGGRVRGDCIECPFHGWSFRGTDGKCVHVPYTDKVPEFSKINTRVSCEANGLILVWFHAEGESPSWEVIRIPEISNGLWSYRGRTQHTVNCHIQEIAENGADVAHLNELHSASVLQGNSPWKTTDRWWSSLLPLKHTWTPSWAVGDQAHLVRLSLSHKLSLWGIVLPFMTFSLDITQVGPALVLLRSFSCFGRGVLVQSVTPEGPLRQRLTHAFYAESLFPRIIDRLFLMGEAAMVERDIVIWNNKRLLRQPMLVAEDKLVLKFRRWYSQFYSEHSPTLQSLRNKTLDW